MEQLKKHKKQKLSKVLISQSLEQTAHTGYLAMGL